MTAPHPSPPAVPRFSRARRHVRGRPVLHGRPRHRRAQTPPTSSATSSSGSSSRTSRSRTDISDRTTCCRTRTRFRTSSRHLTVDAAAGRRLPGRRSRAELHLHRGAAAEAGVHRRHPARQPRSNCSTRRSSRCRRDRAEFLSRLFAPPPAGRSDGQDAGRRTCSTRTSWRRRARTLSAQPPGSDGSPHEDAQVRA